MEVLMPLICIPLVVCFLWACIHPRSFGKFIGTLFLRTTKGGAPKETAGLKILGQLVFGIIVTVIFLNIHPVTIFPLGFFWIMWIRSMNKTSKAAEEESKADGQSA